MWISLTMTSLLWTSQEDEVFAKTSDTHDLLLASMVSSSKIHRRAGHSQDSSRRPSRCRFI